MNDMNDTAANLLLAAATTSERLLAVIVELREILLMQTSVLDCEIRPCAESLLSEDEFWIPESVEVPDWANWVACDPDGEWWFFADQPEFVFNHSLKEYTWESDDFHPAHSDYCKFGWGRTTTEGWNAKDELYQINWYELDYAQQSPGEQYGQS